VHPMAWHPWTRKGARTVRSCSWSRGMEVVWA